MGQITAVLWIITLILAIIVLGNEVVQIIAS